MSPLPVPDSIPLSFAKIIQKDLVRNVSDTESSPCYAIPSLPLSNEVDKPLYSDKNDIPVRRNFNLIMRNYELTACEHPKYSDNCISKPVISCISMRRVFWLNRKAC